MSLSSSPSSSSASSSSVETLPYDEYRKERMMDVVNDTDSDSSDVVEFVEEGAANNDSENEELMDAEEDEQLMDTEEEEEEEEDSPLSDDSAIDSDCDTDMSTGQRVKKELSRSQILALNNSTKHCVIYSYYKVGAGVYSTCSQCAINIAQSTDEPMYAIRHHEIGPHGAIGHIWCETCRARLFAIFQCNMCPICTR